MDFKTPYVKINSEITLISDAMNKPLLVLTAKLLNP